MSITSTLHPHRPTCLASPASSLARSCAGMVRSLPPLAHSSFPHRAPSPLIVGHIHHALITSAAGRRCAVRRTAPASLFILPPLGTAKPSGEAGSSLSVLCVFASWCLCDPLPSPAIAPLASPAASAPIRVHLRLYPSPLSSSRRDRSKMRRTADRSCFGSYSLQPIACHALITSAAGRRCAVRRTAPALVPIAYSLLPIACSHEDSYAHP